MGELDTAAVIVGILLVPLAEDELLDTGVVVGVRSEAGGEGAWNRPGLGGGDPYSRRRTERLGVEETAVVGGACIGVVGC